MIFQGGLGPPVSVPPLDLPMPVDLENSVKVTKTKSFLKVFPGELSVLFWSKCIQSFFIELYETGDLEN